MAEFSDLPHLGEHCHVQSCNRLDFLPFVCEHCQHIYCLEHRNPLSHGCILSENRYNQKLGKERSEATVYACTLDSCRNKEVVPISCKHCHRIVCLQHRHQQDHNCHLLVEKSIRSETTTAQLVNKILENAVKNPAKPIGRKSAVTAAKVRLMKMKLNALGDDGTPQKERIYLRIFMPRSSSRVEKSFFFHELWSVGKVIDNVSKREKLANYNHNRDEKQLRLFECLSGSVLATSKSLKELVENGELNSGDNVILEYCVYGTTTLTDYHTYVKD